MDLMLFLFYGAAFTYIGAAIYLANQEELARTAGGPTMFGAQVSQRGTVIRWLVYGIAAMIFVAGILALHLAWLGDMAEELAELDMEVPDVDQTGALVVFVLALVVAILCVRAVLSEPMRVRIQRLVGAGGRYDPNSSVHTVALVLALFWIVITLIQVVIAGGLAGLAEETPADSLALGSVAFQTALFIALAFLGVGVAIRRNIDQGLDRLGMRVPTAADVVWGVGVGAGLVAVMLVLVAVWAALVTPEQFAEQSAAGNQLAGAFNTIPLALLLALSSSISEEILFRGALQPVFGLGLTSLFFALVHIQYTFTPATLIVFIVALALGVLRQRQSTTAAMIAHFVYNFVQLAVAVLGANALSGSAT